jgi:flagellar FliL protein
MADDDREDDENENENEKEKEAGQLGKKKKIIIFAALIILLIGLSVGGTIFAVKMLSPDPEVEVILDENGNPIPPEVVEEVVAEEPEEAEEPETKKPAIYFPLKPPIIVNFQSRGRQRFMQVDISLMTRDDDVIEAIEIHMPMLRNSLVLKFGGKNYEELQTEEGRELLRNESLKELQDIIEREIGKPGIEKLLFTNLVMQ